MAFRSITPSGMFWPVRGTHHSIGQSGGLGFAPGTLSGAGDKLHMVGQVQWSDGGSSKTVSTIHVLLGVVTWTTSVLRIGLQGVTTANPHLGDGTFGRSGTASAGTDDTKLSVTMSSGSTTYSDGDLVSITADFSVFTSGDSIAINAVASPINGQLPAVFRNTTGVNGSPIVLLESADGKLGWLAGGTWAESSTEEFYSQASTPEHGIVFTAPFACKVNSAWLPMRGSNSAATASLILYPMTGNTPGAALLTKTLDASWFGSLNSSMRRLMVSFPEITLTAGASYALVVKNTSSASSIGLNKVLVGTAAYRAALPGGTSVAAIVRTGGSGDFTPDTTAYYNMGVGVSALDDGVAWTPNAGTAGTHLKVLVNASAQGDTAITGVVFAAPGGSDIAGPRIGEFTGQTFEASLESGQAVLKVPLSAFGGTGLVTTDTPVVCLRNATDTTGIIPATVIVI